MATKTVETTRVARDTVATKTTRTETTTASKTNSAAEISNRDSLCSSRGAANSPLAVLREAKATPTVWALADPPADNYNKISVASTEATMVEISRDRAAMDRVASAKVETNSNRTTIVVLLE